MALVAALLKVKAKGPGGRLRTYPLCEIVTGMLYVLRGGIAWRMMRSDLPPQRFTAEGSQGFQVLPKCWIVERTSHGS